LQILGKNVEFAVDSYFATGLLPRDARRIGKADSPHLEHRLWANIPHVFTYSTILGSKSLPF